MSYDPGEAADFARPRFLVSDGRSLVTGATVNKYVVPAESTPWAGQWSKFHPATPPRTAIPIRAPAAVHAASRLIAYIAGPLSLSPPRRDRAGTRRRSGQACARIRCRGRAGASALLTANLLLYYGTSKAARGYRVRLPA